MSTVGISYPFRISRTTGRVVLSSGDNHIKEAIRRVIQYAKYGLVGERIGSGARERIFDVKSGTMLGSLIANCKYAIDNHVPEVTNVFVSVVKDENDETLIVVKYKIKETAETDSTQVLL